MKTNLVDQYSNNSFQCWTVLLDISLLHVQGLYFNAFAVCPFILAAKETQTRLLEV